MLLRSRMLALLAICAFAKTGVAQFGSEFLQNNSYWGDGKAEFNIYDAQIVRYGQPRACEVLHILVREPMDSKQFVKPDDWQKNPNTIAVLKMNQILHVPTGIYVYQQMFSGFWRVDNAQLWKWSLTSSDSCGNTYKEVHRAGDAFSYDYRTYWDGMAEGRENIAPLPNGFFYDELPWRVRTIDFRKPGPPFEIQLAGSAINSKKDTFAFKPAKVSFTANEHVIDVSVQHTAGTDHFLLDRDGPYLLREWNAADGSKLKMKRNLKLDYWNYNKPGDRERAFNDPMLRQPD